MYSSYLSDASRSISPLGIETRSKLVKTSECFGGSQSKWDPDRYTASLNARERGSSFRFLRALGHASAPPIHNGIAVSQSQLL